MSRERAEHVAQGTWRSGSLHVWGWNGDSTASAAWLYGGFGHNRWSGAENGWHDTPASYGELSRIELELPSGRRKSVPSVRLDPYGAAVWLSDTPGADELSASLEWFAAAERIRRRPRHRGPARADDRRGGPVCRRPLDSRPRRRDRADARRPRRRRTADLPQRHPSHVGRHARRPGRWPGPVAPPQRQLEARPRPSALGARPGVACGVHGARARRCRGPRWHERVPTRARVGARAAAPARRTPRRPARVRTAAQADDPRGRRRSVGGHARGLRRARSRSVVYRRRHLERVWRRPRPGSRRTPPPPDGTARQRPCQHRGRAHPRPRRSRQRARAVWGRARPRRGRRLPRHRAPRAGTPRHRADRTRTSRPGQGGCARARDAGTGRRPAPALRRRGTRRLVGGHRRHPDLRRRAGPRRGRRVAVVAHREPMGAHRPGRSAPGANPAERSPARARVARRRRPLAPGERQRGHDHVDDVQRAAGRFRRRAGRRAPRRDRRVGRRPPGRSPRRASRGGARGRHVQGRAAPLPAPRPGVDAVPRPPRARRLPRRRHGARQDGHHARPPRRADGTASRRVSAQRGPQLGGRVRPVHAVVAGRGPPRRRAPTQWPGLVRARRRRPRRHHLRPARAATSTRSPQWHGPRSCSTRRR